MNAMERHIFLKMSLKVLSTMVLKHKSLPQHKDLIKFEDDPQKMISKVQFRRVNNDFQNRLQNDIRSIQYSKKVFVFADKTRNIYEIEKSHYKKLLTDHITKTYKKSNNIYNSINLEAKHTAKKLEIACRVECMARKPAYKTLKDHKENFNTKPESELRKVDKIIVDNINKTIREKLHCNQWKNTSVIDWFQNITNKGNCIFIQFDIEEFYPSITKHLLLKAIEHAKLYTSITQQELDIILHARKSLFSKNKPCQKTINESLFDITMRSYYGAEICKLVSLNILSILWKAYGIQNIGLYQEDDLACLHKISGPGSEKIWKDIIRTFQENFSLKTTIITNLKTVNFLDFTFDLCTGRQKPNLTRNQPTHLLVSMSTQTICLISSRHCQRVFQNE